MYYFYMYILYCYKICYIIDAYKITLYKCKMVEVSTKCHLSHHSGQAFYRVATISNQVYEKDFMGMETREKQPVFMANELI